MLTDSTTVAPFDLQSPTLPSGTASLAAFAALSHDISSSVASILLSTTNAAIHPHLFQAWSFPPSPRSDASGAFTPDDTTHAAAVPALEQVAPGSVTAASVRDGVVGGASRYAEDEQLPALMGVSWSGGQQPGDAQVLKQPAQRSISPTRERRKAASSSPSPTRLHCSADRTAPSHHACHAMTATCSQGQYARNDPQNGASYAAKTPSSSPAHGSPSAASRGADPPRRTHPPPLMAPGVPNVFSTKPPRPPRHSSKAASRGLRSGDARKPSAGGSGGVSRLMGGRRKASGEAAVMMPLIILLLALFLVLTFVQGLLSTEQAKRILADPNPRTQKLTGLTWHDLVQGWNGSSSNTNSTSPDVNAVPGSPYSSMNRKLGGSPPYTRSGAKQSLAHIPLHTLGQQAKLSLAGMAELSRLKHVATWPLRRLLR
ncbi:hypothetical protein CLOM_g21896 [Closterium sp. NIES-68]|nr:hypothetical protein CLOM_g21896 [Closterium sp. NIES-68]GJP85112.1 hypothetical protein CLOP_g15208 [Closterium sp. NIES-67]